MSIPCAPGSRASVFPTAISNADRSRRSTIARRWRRIDGGEDRAALYNNCSGKHTGFLTTAVHRGEPTRGYIKLEHPVQQRILGTLEQICGLDLGARAARASTAAASR